MIFSSASLDLMPSLEIEKFSESAAFSSVKILLHQGKRDARTSSQPARKQHRRFHELGIGDHPIDNPERERLCGIKRFGGKSRALAPCQCRQAWRENNCHRSRRKSRYWRKP